MVLQDKVSIITGGSMGIGKAIATAFAKEGSSLVLVARTKSELEAAKQELGNLTAKVEVFEADISKEKEVTDMVDFTLEKFTTVDVLVNCAGVLGPMGFTTDIDSEQWVQTMNINVYGTFLCIKAVLPTMVKNKRGKIINFAGGGGDTPRPRFSAYSTSKAAVLRLTDTIAGEVSEYNIDVNSIAPGPVATRMLYQRLAAGNIIGEREAAFAIQHKKEGGVPREKVAELAVFLASSRSDGLSGKEINLLTDNWQEIPGRLNDIMSSDVYNLRRIEPKDRGYNW